LLQRIKNPASEVSIAVVGKYMKHHDAYKSVFEALDHAGISLSTRVLVRRVEAEDLEHEGAERILSGVDGLLVPGGFGYRGIPGKIEGIRYARERAVPFFGICLGLQCAVIEFARNVLCLKDAHTTEVEPNCPHPVVCLLDEQYHITSMGGTMRLGAYPCALLPDSRAHRAYGSLVINERHRHRYEFNNRYRQQFQERGLVFSGTSPNGQLVEAIELANHPWFLAVQCHPEFKSKPTRAHPLFRAFVQASMARRDQKKGIEAGRALNNRAPASAGS
jgi:CTP synthase